MIWCTALGVWWDILCVGVKIEKGLGCCRQSKVGPMETKLIFLRESRQETSPSLHPVQEGREAFRFGIGNI
jgi:hypothetical protein